MISIKINAVSLPRISPIEIKFLNGKVIIPGRHGAYVVASGCGAGKTTAIKEIIKHCYTQGVLYAAFTIEECNEMYNYCRTFLNEDQIVLLHSDEGSLKELDDKYVIICTQYRLINEYPELLYKYDKNIVPTYSLSYISRLSNLSTGEVKNYPRQLILIDGIPTHGFKVNSDDVASTVYNEIKTDKNEIHLIQALAEHVYHRVESRIIVFDNNDNSECSLYEL